MKKSALLSTTSRVEKPSIQLANDLVIEKWPIANVKRPQRNVRKISMRGIAHASALLNRYGQVVPVLITDDGTIIAGDEFYVAAGQLSWTHLNVVRISEINDSDRRALTLALSKLPQLSEWDEDILRVELIELAALNLDFDILDITGFTVGEVDVIMDPEGHKNESNPLDILPPPLPEVVTRLRDLWILGPHRIICGNALEMATYSSLMAGKVARSILTDPPYNVRIAGNVSGLGRTKHGDFAMGVGEMSCAEFSKFLETMLTLSCSYVVDGALVFVFMDRRKLGELLTAADRAKLTIIDLCIWNKMSGGMGGLYRSQHEPCFVFKYGQSPHLNNVQLGKHGRYRTNLWDHRGYSSFGKGRDDALKAHPTVKPVAMLAEAIKDCTKRSDIVLDPFAGSGSTIIAAEKTGRVGFGIELEPKYVDVIIQRWEAMTGQAAILEATGVTFAELRKQRLENLPDDIHQPSSHSQPDRMTSNSNLAGVRIRIRPAPQVSVLEVNHG